MNWAKNTDEDRSSVLVVAVNGQFVDVEETDPVADDDVVSEMIRSVNAYQKSILANRQKSNGQGEIIFVSSVQKGQPGELFSKDGPNIQNLLMSLMWIHYQRWRSQMLKLRNLIK